MVDHTRYDRAVRLPRKPLIPPVEEGPPTDNAGTPSESPVEEATVTDRPTVGDSHPENVEVSTFDLDDEELDAKWGLDSAEVTVGHGAPPVVAVLIASDPGEWFEETLESLRDVEYENFSILVLDNAGDSDPVTRIASIVPSAFVKRLETDEGFSAAANEVITSVEGAAFLLILHDDVALEPDAVTAMVAEAFRSNSGVVGPKLVDWNEPEVLRSVGIRVDPYGFSSQISEIGEIDQSQHDAVKDVFAVSDACMLVRADLFRELGGFDQSLPFFGEDIDLCWRAHAAGASVSMCTDARVRHIERFEDRRAIDDRQRLQIRHEARTMLKNYSTARLIRVLPVAFLLSVVDLIGSTVLGHFRRAADIASAWFWNIGHLRSLLKARSQARSSRRVPDREYIPLMRKGSSRLRGLFRGAETENRLQALAESGRGYLANATSRSRRGGLALMAVALVLIVYGGRGLVTGPIPAMREIPELGRSSGALISEWFSGWRESGLGEPAVAPGVFPMSGFLSWVLLGSLGLVRRVILVAPLVVGAVGAWKLLSRTESTAARAAALAVYGLNPVVLNALAQGRISALVAYAVAPWLLRRVARSGGVRPFGEAGATSDIWRSGAGAALMLGLVAAFSLLAALVLLVTLVVCGIPMLWYRPEKGSRRMLTLVALAGLGAAILSIPWLVATIRNGDWASWTGMWPTSAASPSATRIMTGSLGPVKVGVLGWGIPLAALVALATAKRWRLRWAGTAWVLILGSWAGAVMVAKAGLFGGAGLQVLLVPAVLGLSIAVGMGVLAFEEDVLGSDFGASQLLSGVGVVGLCVGLVPVGVASLDGRWFLPESGFNSVLAPIEDSSDFRTMWIGDPESVPIAGWSLGAENLVVGLSAGLEPSLTQRYRLDGGTSAHAAVKAVKTALNGESKRLGRLLGPMGIKYVIVVDRPVPVPFSAAVTPRPERLIAALGSQLDLNSIDVNPAMAMFEVDQPWPYRGDVTASAGVLDDVGSIRDQLAMDVPVPRPVLGTGTGTSFTGRLDHGTVVSHAVTADPGWSLSVDRRSTERNDLLGWGQSFETETGGRAELSWSTPWTYRALQLIQIGALLALVALALLRGRRHLRLAEGPDRGPSTRVVEVGPTGLIEDRTTAITAAESVESAETAESVESRDGGEDD